MSYTSRISMSSNKDDCDYLTPKGIKLRFGSYWAWDKGETTYYYRLVCIQDSAGGLHAVIDTAERSWVGCTLEAFENKSLREVTDEDEIAFAALSLT
jgi:hypothetical protein